MKITIENLEYNLPENILDVNARQGFFLDEYVSKYGTDKLRNKIAILSILMDCPESILRIVKREEIESLFDSINYVNADIVTPDYTVLKIDGKKYGICDTENFSVEEYYKCEALRRDVIKNAPKIASLFLRRVKKIRYSYSDRFLNIAKRFIKNIPNQIVFNSGYELVPYDDIDPNENIGEKLSIIMFPKIMRLIEAFDAKLKVEFPPLFGDSRKKLLEEKGIVDEYATTDGQDDEYANPYGIYHTVFGICGGVKTEIDCWLKKNIKELLFHMCYLMTIKQ